LTGVTDHASLTKAIANAVAGRAAAGKSPYIAFIWFFGTAIFSPFDQNMLSPLTKDGCRFFRSKSSFTRGLFAYRSVKWWWGRL
jgi:hypothetical protein